MDFTTTSPAARYAVRTPPAADQSIGSAGSSDGRRNESYAFEPFGDDGLTFEDVLDVINPLQHIPVLSTLYREWTDDQIDPIPRIAGGALFGGITGAIASLVNVVVDEITGSDIGEHVLAFASDMLGIGDSEPTEMYAGAGTLPDSDGATVPLEVASGGGRAPGPVAKSVDILDWPHIAADPAAGTIRQDPKSNPSSAVLEKRMASVRQGQVTDFMIMAMSIYEKGEHSATERVTPKIDILS